VSRATTTPVLERLERGGAQRPPQRYHQDAAVVEGRKRFAFTPGNIHGRQRLHVASVPRGEFVNVSHLRPDDCQVVYECPMYQPRS